MKFTTIADAVSCIKDSSLICFSGMELNRAPMALVGEIARQKKRNLRVISTPNPLPLDALIKAGCVRQATFTFNGFSFEDGFVIAPNWRNAIENNLIEWKETDAFEILQSLKAGSLGIGSLEVPYFQNTDYLSSNRYQMAKNHGRNVIIADAINPDFALIHAQNADEQGNVFIEDPLTDKLIANASKNVIVTVEKITKKIKSITIPKEKIKFLAEQKFGALPTSCFGFYDYDADAIRRMIPERQKSQKLQTAKSTLANECIDCMVLSMAEIIKDGSVVATGVASALPMIAIMLAKRCGKKFSYINCTGALNPEINKMPYSSVTINALQKKDSFIELHQIWELAIKHRIDTMFFGAAQISANGDVNMTCIGDFKHPRIKLPGPAGAVTLRNLCKNPIIVTMNHTKKTFVEKVDFATSKSPVRDTLVITNLGVLKLGKEPQILSVHPHSSVEEILSNTCFELKSAGLDFTPKPSAKDIKLLNEVDSSRIRYKLR